MWFSSSSVTRSSCEGTRSLDRQVAFPFYPVGRAQSAEPGERSTDADQRSTSLQSECLRSHRREKAICRSGQTRDHPLPRRNPGEWEVHPALRLALSYVYHLHENFGLQLIGQYNWYSRESGFNQELIDKVREEAQAATSLLLVWALQAGLEVTPIYGKFAFLDGSLAHFSLVISAGA